MLKATRIRSIEWRYFHLRSPITKMYKATQNIDIELV